MNKTNLILAVLALLLLAGGLSFSQEPQFKPGTRARVTHATAVLRSAPRFFSSSVQKLKEGDAVDVLAVKGPWVEVRAGSAKGFLHSSALLDDRSYSLAVKAGAGDVTYAERAAAARGFNPKVEQRRRKDNPDLDRGYRLLDDIESRSLLVQAVIDFRRAGGLDQ